MATTFSNRSFRPALFALCAAAALAGIDAAWGDASWVARAPMPTGRYDLAAAALAGKIYVVGGDDRSFGGDNTSSTVLECYDPATDAWSAKAPMPTGRQDFAQVAAAGGSLYVIGGAVARSAAATTTVEAYDPASNSWTTKASLTAARGAMGVAEAGGKIYVIGGNDADGSYLSTVQVYDPATNSWAAKAPISAPRQMPLVAVVDGIVYAIGGWPSDQARVVEAYDPASDAWTTKASAPEPVFRATVGVVDGEIYAIGGDPQGNGQATNTVQIYSPSTNSWRSGTATTNARLFAASATVGRTIYVIGGTSGAGWPHFNTLVESFTPEVPLAVHAPAPIVQTGATADPSVTFSVEVTGNPPATATLTVRDVTGSRWLLSEAATAGEVSVGPNTFPLGTSTIEIQVADGAQVLASASFTIRIEDTVAPALAGTGSRTIEATGAATPISVASLGVTATDAFDASPAVTLSHASLPLGTTQVTATAEDASHNTSTSVFGVTVEDTTPPVIGAVSGVDAEATGPSGAIVTFPSPAATDTVDAAPAVVCAPASGSTFAVGTTTVVCTATDASGNVATRSFVVSVHDTTPPALTLPTNFTLEATDPAGALASFSATAADLVDGSVPVISAPVSGSTFALGSTTVQCSATDSHGNTAMGTFTVIVRDTTAPALTLPADLVVEATGSGGAVVTFAPSASDLADGAVAVSCTPASGSTFALGTTTVQCSATDAHGNSVTGSFHVTVRDTTLPALSVTGLPATIWAPNHRLVRITPSVSVSDAADAAPAVTVAVTCNQGSASDAVVHSATDIELRAERTGGSERVYTLTWTASDASGNVSVVTATVTVPHSQGH